MSYRTTEKADLDIALLYREGAGQFGVAQAERYLLELFETFDLLAENPRLARERADIDPPVRIHPYKSHLIVYLAEDSDILIVRVLHGRRKWQGLL